MDATPADDNLGDKGQHSPLLTLPAEMRSAIYHLCLTFNNGVWITPGLRPPALLSTCRQIRSESVPIYYTVNSFHIMIRGCDTRLFQAYVENLSLPEHVEDLWSRKVSVGGIKWANLVGWCRAVWEKKLRALRLEPAAPSEWSIVQVATDIADRGLDWEVVEEMLNGLKVVAGNIDGSWVE